MGLPILQSYKLYKFTVIATIVALLADWFDEWRTNTVMFVTIYITTTIVLETSIERSCTMLCLFRNVATIGGGVD